jgi:hypothetical protein
MSRDKLSNILLCKQLLLFRILLIAYYSRSAITAARGLHAEYYWAARQCSGTHRLSRTTNRRHKKEQRPDKGLNRPRIEATLGILVGQAFQPDEGRVRLESLTYIRAAGF